MERVWTPLTGRLWSTRITSYNVCYTKLLRKQEAYGLFAELMETIKEDICNSVFRVHTVATYESMFPPQHQRTEHTQLEQFGGLAEGEAPDGHLLV